MLLINHKCVYLYQYKSKVAELLGVDIKDLLNSSNPSVNEKVIIIKNN